MRQMDRQARRQQHLQAQRVGRTPAGIAMDSEVMRKEMLNFSNFSTLQDRIFIAFATPLPCDHCEQLRNIGEASPCLVSASSTKYVLTVEGFMQGDGPAASSALQLVFGGKASSLFFCFSTF